MSQNPRYDKLLAAASKMRQQVLLLYAAGSTQSALARRFGVTRQRINQIVNAKAAKARKTIHDEVSRKVRPQAYTLNCTDCGEPAEEYDHRDYKKPRKVEPVCGPCNKKRGPGKNGKLQ